MASESTLPPLAPPGVVELREDVPLKAGGAGAGSSAGRVWCAAGPRFILASFGALSAAITLALLTQVYSGDYEVVPHGSVSSGAAECSRAGTEVLKAGGHALDAAAAAALCLAVLAPHRTSLDASGALLYWEYRQLRTQQPLLAEWGPPETGPSPSAARPPRLLAALATLHAAHGMLAWSRVLQPAVDLARDGFPVSVSLAAALVGAGPGSLAGTGLTPAGAGPVTAGATMTAPVLAAYLESLQHNTSAELSAAWGSGARVSGAAALAVGGARVWAGGAGASTALRALSQALDPPPATLDVAQARAEQALALEAGAARDAGGPGAADSGVASGLAVIDPQDTYLALVTGLSQAFGSGARDTGNVAGDAGSVAGDAGSVAGWRRDEPIAALDLAPAIITDSTVCGTRYVVGAESGGTLATVGALLAAGGGAAAVERPRAHTPAANLVQQQGDALLSHADSRAGGLASRF